MFDMYADRARQAIDEAALNPSPGPPRSFGEAFDDAFTANRAYQQSFSKLRAQQAVMGDVLDKFRQKTGEDLPNPYLFPEAPGDQAGPTKQTNFQRYMVQAQTRYEATRRERPDLALDPFPTPQDIDTRAMDRQTKAGIQYERQLGRDDHGVADFFGAAAGSMTDPVNVAAMALGLGSSAAMGVVRTAVAEGVVGAGSQAVVTGLNYQNRRQVDPAYGPEAAAYEIAAGGAGGAVLGGGLKLLGKGLAHILDTANRPALPRSMNDAINVVRSDVRDAETTPFPTDAGANAVHQDTVASVAEALRKSDSEPVTVAPEVTALHEQAAPVSPATSALDQLAPSPLDLAMRGELSADRARAIADDLKGGVKNLENTILGDRADEWRTLQRQSNTAANRADDAAMRGYDDRIAAIEGALNPSDRDALYGIGGSEYSDPAAWRSLASKLQEVEATKGDAVQVLAGEARHLPDHNDWSKMNPQEQEAVITTLHAMNAEQARGGDPMALVKDAFAERFARYGGDADARDLAQGQMQHLEQLLRDGIQNEGGAAPPMPSQLAHEQATPDASFDRISSEPASPARASLNDLLAKAPDTLDELSKGMDHDRALMIAHEMRMANERIEDQIFGPTEGARYRALLNQTGDSNVEFARQARAELNKIDEGLSQGDRDILSGEHLDIRPEADPVWWRKVAKTLGEYGNAHTQEDAGANLGHALLNFPKTPDWAAMTYDQRLSMIGAQAALNEAERLGMTAKEAFQKAEKYYRGHFSDPQDAEFMFKSVMEAVRANRGGGVPEAVPHLAIEGPKPVPKATVTKLSAAGHSPETIEALTNGRVSADEVRARTAAPAIKDPTVGGIAATHLTEDAVRAAAKEPDAALAQVHAAEHLAEEAAASGKPIMISMEDGQPARDLRDILRELDQEEAMAAEIGNCVIGGAMVE